MTTTMADDYFDPYYKWLAIPPEDQPPDHYRLLGVQRFESDADVIATAADQRMAHLRTFQAGKHGAHSQQLLNEIAVARVCLLNPTRKSAYDQQLRVRLPPQAPALPPAAPLSPPAAPPMGPIGPPVGPQASYAPPFRSEGAMPARAPMPIRVAPPAADDTAGGAAGIDVEGEPQIGSLPGSRRGRKKKQSSALAIGPLVAVGVVAAVAFVAYLASSQSAPSPTPAAMDEKKHSAAEAVPGTISADKATPRRETVADDEPADGPADGPPDETVKPNVDEARPTKTPKTELLSPAAKRLLRQVAAHVQKGSVEQSEPAGGSGGRLFEEIPLDGALLVGLNLKVGKVAGNLVLRAVQGVYLSPQGIVDGEPHGDLGSEFIKLLAKPGYAVGGAKVRGGSFVDGLSLTFMRIHNDHLDPRDAYSSDWVGGQGGGAPVVISGDGRAVVGVFGGIGAAVDRFGLMLDEEGAMPAGDKPSPEMPMPDPNESRPLTARPSLLPQRNRLPVPPAEAQKEAQTLIHSLFKDDFTDAVKGPPQKMALAVKLFHKAEETNDDPTARFVLISEARDLAARCGDSLAVADAILLLANNYDIDDVGMTLASFEKAAEVTTAPLQFRRKLVENCILLIDRAVGQEKYDVAEQLLAIGRRGSSKAQDSILTQRIAWRAAKLHEQKAAYDAVREPLELLNTQPNDPQALLAVGRYRCFYQDDWRVGLPLIAKGSDAGLKAVALQELADQGNSDDQLKLAEAWEALAKTDEKQRANYERRARFWYARAVVGLRGIIKAKAEKKLDDLLGGRGLKAEYFRGDELAANERVLTRIDPNIDFNWGQASPVPEMPANQFSVRWSGLLVGPTKGEYQLTVDHDDGVRIWLDGKMTLDKWDKPGTDQMMFPMAGKPRAIKIEYRENITAARIILKWAQKGGFAEQVIPPEAFWQEHATGARRFRRCPIRLIRRRLRHFPGAKPRKWSETSHRAALARWDCSSCPGNGAARPAGQII